MAAASSSALAASAAALPDGKKGGELYMCGSADYGMLGIGLRKMPHSNEPRWLRIPSLVPVKVGPSSALVQVACGFRHTLGLTDFGELYSWGSSYWYTCGHGDRIDYLEPKLVMFFVGKRVVSIACHTFNSAAITESGHLFTWGEGQFGRLGHNDEGFRSEPTLLESLSDQKIAQVACGTNHTLCLTEKGEVYAWGDNSNGQLGLNSEMAKSLSPALVDTLRGKEVIYIACGNFHSAAVTKSGELWTWGHGKYGQLGFNDPKDLIQPRFVKPLQSKRIIQVSCGNFFTAAVTDDGRVFTFGYDGEYHRLGHGDKCAAIVRMPEQVRALSKVKVKFASCGANHMAVMTEKSDVWIWGCGFNGQLGDKKMEIWSIPKQIPRPFEGMKVKITCLSCGVSSSTAIINHVSAQEEIRRLKEQSQAKQLLELTLREENERLKEQIRRPVTSKPPPTAAKEINPVMRESYLKEVDRTAEKIQKEKLQRVSEYERELERRERDPDFQKPKFFEDEMLPRTREPGRGDFGSSFVAPSKTKEDYFRLPKKASSEEYRDDDDLFTRDLHRFKSMSVMEDEHDKFRRVSEEDSYFNPSKPSSYSSSDLLGSVRPSSRSFDSFSSSFGPKSFGGGGGGGKYDFLDPPAPISQRLSSSRFSDNSSISGRLDHDPIESLSRKLAPAQSLSKPSYASEMRDEYRSFKNSDPLDDELGLSSSKFNPSKYVSEYNLDGDFSSGLDLLGGKKSSLSSKFDNDGGYGDALYDDLFSSASYKKGSLTKF